MRTENRRQRFMAFVEFMAFVGFAGLGVRPAFAGNLDSSAAPTDDSKDVYLGVDIRQGK